MGQMLQNHLEDGTHVHLFVRPTAKAGGKTQPFIYCGELEFERWDGDRPITVWWRLQDPVATALYPVLRIESTR